MTNMSCKLYFCMSADHIFVTYCMSNMDIAGFCACLCCTSLCFETTYFGGIWQYLPTCSALVQSPTLWSGGPEIESHTCVWWFFFLICLDMYEELSNNGVGVWKKIVIMSQKKEKSTLSNCMSESNMHVHMKPHLHVRISDPMSEIWWFIIACSTCIQNILHVHKATFFQIACPLCKVHVSKLQLCKLHVQHAIWKWIACSRAELFSDGVWWGEQGEVLNLKSKISNRNTTGVSKKFLCCFVLLFFLFTVTMETNSVVPC